MASVAYNDVDLTTAAPELREVPIRPHNTAFILVHHRTSWSARLGAKPEQDRILPDLIVRSMQPGTNGIGEFMRGNDAEKLRTVRAAAERDRTIVMPPNEGPVTAWNPAGKGYLAVTETREPGRGNSPIGRHYFCKWERLLPSSDRVEFNLSKFDAFLDYWQRKGLIPVLPPYDVVLAAIGDITGRLSRLVEQESNKAPTLRRANLARELAAWEKVRDAHTDATEIPDDIEAEALDIEPVEVEPAPVKRGRKSKDVHVGPAPVDPEAPIVAGFAT